MYIIIVKHYVFLGYSEYSRNLYAQLIKSAIISFYE